MRALAVAGILALAVTGTANAATYQAIYSGGYLNYTPGMFGISSEGPWSLKFNFDDGDVFAGPGPIGMASGPTVNFVGDLTFGSWSGKAAGHRFTQAGSGLGADGKTYYWSYDYISFIPLFDWEPLIADACSQYVQQGYYCGAHHLAHIASDIRYQGSSTDPIGGMTRSSPVNDEPDGAEDLHYTFATMDYVISEHRINIPYWPGDNFGEGIVMQYSLSLDRFTVSAIPEPATWAMMVIGFGALGTMVRTRRRSAFGVA